jgi:hypothetical protein
MMHSSSNDWCRAAGRQPSGCRSETASCAAPRRRRI